MKISTTWWGWALGMAVALLAGGSGGTQAATRFWMLQNVVFDDGTTIVGSFGYDDMAAQVTDWNIRVQGGSGHLPFTYVPGDSTAEAYPDAYLGIVFYATGDVNAAKDRLLSISVLDTLDGTPAVVPILPSFGSGAPSRELFPFRKIVAGSLVLVPFPPPVGLVDVIEFYHAGFDHFVMSADPAEINALDTGYFTGWARTGQQFQAYATGSSAGPTMNPVCRYYGLPSAGLDSHFYSASTVECFQVNEFYGTEWQIESDNVFQIDLPNAATGACPSGTIPVYRLFNHRADANHRYTTSTMIRAQMEAAGWIREGYGPDATIMCATSF